MLQPPARIRMQVIADAIALEHGIFVTQLKGHCQAREYSVPRQKLMWFLRQDKRNTLQAIAEFLNYRDHTTIIHGVRRHIERMADANQLS